MLHESYTYCCDYDIALIRLRTPLTYNDYVKPVCLPNSPVAVGTNCISTGWGKTEGKQNQTFGTLYAFSFCGHISDIQMKNILTFLFSK